MDDLREFLLRECRAAAFQDHESSGEAGGDVAGATESVHCSVRREMATTAHFLACNLLSFNISI